MMAQFKSPLGHSHQWIDRTCETCGEAFKRLVKNVVRGGGRFCSKRCNPAYGPKEPAREKYRRYNLQKYGLTPATYEALLQSQRGVCAICGMPPRDLSVSRHARLHVDHDHATGVVRGLLCMSCNRALGWFRDHAGLLASAIDYLKRSKTGAANEA